MAEENKLERYSGTSAGSIPTHAIVPNDLNFDRIRTIVQNTAIGALDKRRLVKQEMRALIQQRKDQIQAALVVEGKKIQANINIADKAIQVYEGEMLFHIRERFLDMVSKLGMRVEMKQLKFLSDFGEELKQFKTDLKKKNIEPRVKERILKVADDAFERIADKLAALTTEMIKKAEEHGEK